MLCLGKGNVASGEMFLTPVLSGVVTSMLYELLIFYARTFGVNFFGLAFVCRRLILGKQDRLSLYCFKFFNHWVVDHL